MEVTLGYFEVNLAASQFQKKSQVLDENINFGKNIFPVFLVNYGNLSSFHRDKKHVFQIP